MCALRLHVRLTQIAWLALAACALLAAMPAWGGGGANINVAAGAVVIANDGVCSLREAIINANNAAQTHDDCTAGSSDIDFLILATGSTYTISNAAESDASGNTGLPYITKSLSIEGRGATIQSGNTCNFNGTQTASEFRLMAAVVVGLIIRDLTLANGCADGTGDARFGGAIYLKEGLLRMYESTVRNNRAHSGAGIYIDNNLFPLDDYSFIHDSTLSFNTATLGGALNVNTRVWLVNSTISNNSTTSLGAGAYLRPDAVLQMDFVTVDGSSSAQPSEIYASAATVRINGSILRNARCAADGAAAPSTWIARGNNADTGSTCASLFGSNFAASAIINLGPLADNGGPTQTRALLAGSQAIDGAIECTFELEGVGVGVVDKDQRGEVRPQGVDFSCDLGAFESALSPPPQTIYVDEVDGVGVVAIQADGLCSLREAFENANRVTTRHADCEAGGGLDTIVLPPGAVFTVSDAHVSDNYGRTALPAIVSGLTLRGQGATIQRSLATPCLMNGVVDPGETRLLRVFRPTTIEDLNLANGCADGPEENAPNGGAIFGQAALTIRRSTIRDSQAESGGGLWSLIAMTIDSSTLSGNSASLGGAAYLLSNDFIVRNSTISGNSATGAGGAFAVLGFADLRIEQSTLSGNTAANGGAVWTSAAGAHIHNVILHGSSCPDFIPGFFNLTATGSNLDSGSSCDPFFSSNYTPNATLNLAALANNGGTTRTHALLAGSQALNAAGNCSFATDQRGVVRPQGACDIGAFEAHTAPTSSPNIEVDAVSGVGVVPVLGDGLCSLREAFENAGATSTSFLHGDCEPGTVSGLDHIFLAPDAVYTLTEGAQTAPFGRTALPRISSLLSVHGNGATIQSGNPCTFNGLADADEFRLFLVDAGALGLLDLTLANGCADGSTNASVGGAVLVNAGAGLTLLNTTLRDHRAARGGALHVEGVALVETSTLNGNQATSGAAVYANGPVTLSNSTVSGNTASGQGGAVYVDTGAVLSAENVSFHAHTPASASGIFATAGTVNLKNTILSDTTCVSFGTTSTWNGSGNSLDSGTTCATKFGASVAASATILLAPLGNYTGATETHALLPGSQAINAVTSCTRLNGSNLAADQRGIVRPRGNACDIGAYESRGFNLIAMSGFGQSTIVGTAFASPLVASISSVSSEPVNGGLVRFLAPDTGASLATPSSLVAIIGGQASRTASANAVVGSYGVGASASGAGIANFSLTNIAAPLAPTVSYNPGPGPVTFPAGPAGLATRSISVSSGGGVAPGSVTVSGCSASSGFTISNAPINLTGSAGGTQINGSIALSCMRGANLQTGTLTCSETPNPGSAVIRSWNLSCPTADVPPTANASAANVSSGGATSHVLTVQFTDDVGINVSSLGTGDVTVGGPNGFNATPAFVSVNINNNGTPRTATYNFTPPGGSWDAGDNGTYTITMAAAQVTDTAGSAVAAGSIGSFTVGIAVSLAPTVSYNPGPGPIAFPAGPAGLATRSISVSSSGGVAPGSVTVSGCSASSGFTISNAPINLTGTAGGTQINGSIALSCTRGASLQTGTLTCSETPSPGAALSRSWNLSCPAVQSDLVFRNGFED